jgi:hypothetical protein
LPKRKNKVSLHRFRNKAQRLSHGVMVALQFLVLPDKVRVLVRQHNNQSKTLIIKYNYEGFFIIEKNNGKI